MAFDPNAFRVEYATGSYGAGSDGSKFFRRASYITADAPAVVEAANYFNLAADRAPLGTVICAVMSIGGAVEMKNYVVSGNAAGVVTVKLQKTAAG